MLDRIGELLGCETYKIVPGRGFVNTKQLKAEAAIKEMQYHLRSALIEAGKSLEHIEMFPPETQEALREMEAALRFMAEDAEGRKTVAL